ncbi:alpha/beta hydrolase [Aureibaculum algae]|uniref:Alpha/beta hydrolase n=2 Tax=Aureibaculum algae TaxID=2584122 RepID=A0A5B7TKZ8_9FLAO|nr:alpha/beta hydrolase [Aureibaculum algae]
MIKKIALIFLFCINTILFAQNTPKLMKNIVSEYTYPAKSISIDSLEISYIMEGKGTTTLLFLHGLSSNADAWSKNIETLKNNYICLALDLPGYGKSSMLNVEYTPSFFASITHQLIKKLELKNVVLIGHSMGGQASIKLATTYPKDIQKLILIAPAGLETFKKEQANFMKTAYTAASVKNTTDEQIVTNYALNFYKLPEDAQKMIDDRKHIKNASNFNAHCEAIIKSIAGMLDEPVFDQLKDIKQKTLVIFGNEDKLIPNRYFNPTLSTEKVGNIAKEQIKNVEVEYIPESGHFVQFEKPNQVNLLIEKFVESKE